ncbi:hypothetical protein P7K49_015625 [Saguinus oedipus]|uniref:Uncharacterized protein n=1 Tax=Saguinus oedipus TaxID=9490 RepID=A0ABQ9VA33_SAGOE|nr:hypothetical protein P7K49_015625 [Saguinus oedipus]
MVAAASPGDMEEILEGFQQQHPSLSLTHPPQCLSLLGLHGKSPAECSLEVPASPNILFSFELLTGETVKNYSFFLPLISSDTKKHKPIWAELLDSGCLGADLSS